MKTITISAIIVMVFSCIAAKPLPEKEVLAKNVTKSFDGFSFVRSHRQGRGAEISWAFSSSNASGFAVQRTNEDPNDPYSVWIDVSNVACNSSRSYKCHDDNPFPGFINYRVIAIMNDGSTMTSQLSVLHIMSH
jgi:hypothetical protein